MIWLLKPINRRPMELAPAVDESTGILPGFPPVAGKPVYVAFDGGRMTSDTAASVDAVRHTQPASGRGYGR